MLPHPGHQPKPIARSARVSWANTQRGCFDELYPERRSAEQSDEARGRAAGRGHQKVPCSAVLGSRGDLAAGHQPIMGGQPNRPPGPDSDLQAESVDPSGPFCRGKPCQQTRHSIRPARVLRQLDPIARQLMVVRARAKTWAGGRTLHDAGGRRLGEQSTAGRAAAFQQIQHLAQISPQPPSAGGGGNLEPTGDAADSSGPAGEPGPPRQGLSGGRSRCGRCEERAGPVQPSGPRRAGPARSTHQRRTGPDPRAGAAVRSRALVTASRRRCWGRVSDRHTGCRRGRSPTGERSAPPRPAPRTVRAAARAAWRPSTPR